MNMKYTARSSKEKLIGKGEIQIQISKIPAAGFICDFDQTHSSQQNIMLLKLVNLLFIYYFLIII